MQTPIDAADTPPPPTCRAAAHGLAPDPPGLRSWPVMLALAVLVIIVAIALFAPWLGTVDPVQINRDRA